MSLYPLYPCLVVAVVRGRGPTTQPTLAWLEVYAVALDDRVFSGREDAVVSTAVFVAVTTV